MMKGKRCNYNVTNVEPRINRASRSNDQDRWKAICMSASSRNRSIYFAHATHSRFNSWDFRECRKLLVHRCNNKNSIAITHHALQ